MRFENKTALITGASSGMGLLTSRCIAAEGGCVLMADINPETLARAVAEVNAVRPGSAEGAVCDVRITPRSVRPGTRPWSASAASTFW